MQAKKRKPPTKRDYDSYRKQYFTIYFVDEDAKALVTKAAEKSGISVNAFITQASAEAAAKSLRQKTCGACKGSGRVAA